jgi:Fe2+ or Zn2+ uptake regulation protein
MARDQLAGALQRLHQAGHRLTRPRQAVVRTLLEAGDVLRPEEVLVRGRTLCPTLGLVTVYRTLALLEELGVVRRVHGQGGCHGYAIASLRHGHHIVCRICHQVMEFPGSDDLSRLMGRVSEQTGFIVDDHLLELVGRCPDCQ